MSGVGPTGQVVGLETTMGKSETVALCPSPHTKWCTQVLVRKGPLYCLCWLRHGLGNCWTRCLRGGQHVARVDFCEPALFRVHLIVQTSCI